VYLATPSRENCEPPGRYGKTCGTDPRILKRQFAPILRSGGRRGLVFKAHILLYHSTLGLRVVNKKREGADQALEKTGVVEVDPKRHRRVPSHLPEKEFNLLVRIHFIIVMIRWTGLASWE